MNSLDNNRVWVARCVNVSIIVFVIATPDAMGTRQEEIFIRSKMNIKICYFSLGGMKRKWREEKKSSWNGKNIFGWSCAEKLWKQKTEMENVANSQFHVFIVNFPTEFKSYTKPLSRFHRIQYKRSSSTEALFIIPYIPGSKSIWNNRSLGRFSELAVRLRGGGWIEFSRIWLYIILWMVCHNNGTQHLKHCLYVRRCQNQ